VRRSWFIRGADSPYPGRSVRRLAGSDHGRRQCSRHSHDDRNWRRISNRCRGEVSLMNRSTSNQILQVFTGRDHRQDFSSDCVGQVRPCGHVSGQVMAIEYWPGSAFGSARGTRAAARCRVLSVNRAVVVRRNSRAIRWFRRVMSRAVARALTSAYP
jgi:hypothetical protein